MIKNITKKHSTAGLEISVVICTYNRGNLLRDAIDSVVKQTLAKSMYEIIIVDNGSKGDTAKIVKSFKAKPKMRLVTIPKPGLGHARNIGLKHAQGHYVAFIDDDALADKNWLKRALICFRHTKPSPSVIGGPIYPFYVSGKPIWFKDEYEKRFWGKKGRFLQRDESFSGSNMFFTKEVFHKYGGFGQDIGMKGNIISVGEETSLFEKIWQAQTDNFFYYSPDLIVYHLVPDYKMTVSYQLKRSFVAGCALSKRNKDNAIINKVIKVFIYSFAQVILSFLAIIHLFKYSAYQNWLIEEFGRIAYFLGYVSASMGFFITYRQNR